MPITDPDAVAKALAEFFPENALKWKPQTVKDKRALAICYIDSRMVMNRLDAVVGAANWQDEYTVLTSDSVVCKLSVRFGGEWVAKTDVGSPSEQPDEGDRTKAAFSDALKRAAVKFGVGRYLYSLPHQWVDYDPAKKQLAKRPAVPDAFRPKQLKTAVAPPAQAEPPPPGDDSWRQMKEGLESQLKECKTTKSLHETWSVAYKAGLPDSLLRELEIVKDQMKAKIPHQPNGDGASVENNHLPGKAVQGPVPRPAAAPHPQRA